MDSPATIRMIGDRYDRAYNQFVVENYYGGDSEPITPEFFKESWDEMSEAQRAELVKRAMGE